MTKFNEVKLAVSAIAVACSLALHGGEYAWSGAGSSGDWNDAKNWGDAGVPAAGDIAVFGMSAEVSSQVPVGSGDSLTIRVGSGSIVEFTGVISGSAPIVLEGDGAIGFGGANTFSGDLTINVTTFSAKSDEAFGDTVGSTAFNALGASSRWYFYGITTSEAITIDNNVNIGPSSLRFPANTTNVFNGVWTRKAEQYRCVLDENAVVRFNASLGSDAQYMTVSLGTGSLLDFNVDVNSYSGAPRISGTGTVVYRKRLNLPYQFSDYGFFYQHDGVQMLMAENAFGVGSSAAALTTHYNNGHVVTVDLQGNDQDCACLFGNMTNLTTPEDSPATLHVYNSVNQPSKYSNGGKFAGRVIGPVSIAVEGNSCIDALTLCSESSSAGTLIVRNGGKAVFADAGKWGSGGARVGAGSSIVVVRPNTFGISSGIAVEEGGVIELADGADQTVRELRLGSIIGENGRVYGSLDTSATVDVRSACIVGDGVIRVVSSKVLTWAGPADGVWSNENNWNPVGVPSNGDQLVFDSTAGEISSVNDISTLSLAGIAFRGANPIGVSGSQVTMLNAGILSAEGCVGGIAFALPLVATGSEGLVIRSTAVGGSIASWEFTGAWSGTSDVKFDGDHTGVYSFRQNSPAFTGNLFLSNAGAYHLWNAGALGTTAGYTCYEVRQGDYNSNAGKVLEPFYFHGVDTAENFLLAGLSTFSLHFAADTVNCLRGAIDTPSDRFETINPDVERISVGANAKLTLSGPVAKKFKSGCDVFEIVLFYGEEGSSVVLDSEWGGGHIRAYPKAGATFVLNHEQDKVSSVGVFDCGMFKLGCDHALGMDGHVRFYCGNNNSTYHSMFDLAGHVLETANFVWYSSNRDQLKYIEFVDSVGGGELKYMNPAGDNGDFVTRLGNGVRIAIASSGEHGFNPTACGTGVTLAVENGAAVSLPDGVSVPVAAVTVADGASFNITAGSSVPDTASLEIADGGQVELAQAIDQVLASLRLGSATQSAGYTYGSAQSDADVKSGYFAGRGVVRLPGTIVEEVHVWKGPSGGKWSANENWEPTGPIGFGNVLVFDSTAGAISTENDLDLVKISGIRLKGDNPILLSGKTCRIVAGGMGVQGEEGSLATVDFALPLDLIRESVQPIPYVAASGQVFRVMGAISGAADLVFGGGGAVELHADNAFTGILTMTNGVLDVYANGAFGTTDGKTVIRIPDAVPAGCRAPAVTFHGVTTAENIDWGQLYGAYAGFFAETTTNVFNGALKGVGGQPRWHLAKNSVVTVNGTTSGFEAHTVMTEEGARYEQNGRYDGWFLRFSGAGDLYVAGKCTFDAIGYSLLYSGTPRMIFMGDNLLAQDGEIKYAPLSLGVGTADLNGHTQQILTLCGKAGTTVTNSGERTELRAMMFYDYKATIDGTPIARYDGSVCGPIDFTVEGAAVPTQYLGGVSMSTGKLTVKNGGTVCIDGTGRWSGEADVQAGSKLVFADSARFGKRTILRLSSDAQVYLPEGANIRCRQLFIDGVEQPVGLYNASKDSVHFAGPGSLYSTGVGTVIVVR